MRSKKNRLHILLISVHGLIRGNDLELGSDADTGGQTKYVVDLARSLAKSDQVEQVNLVTRLINDPSVSSNYAQAIEQLSDKARIIRIKAGPDEYIAKEQLWDHLDSFVDNLLDWLSQQEITPDFIHSHYADAGYVGVSLSKFLGKPLIHTGHSLGRDKRKRLLASGLSQHEIENNYNISRRIDAEEDVLANAELVITSTSNEIEEQYSLYNYYDPSCMTVIPPGTNLEQFYPASEGEEIAFKNELKHFLKQPNKPILLALSRPDERKNILSLIEAFGESEALQQRANLVIVAGSRDEINDLEKGARTVFKNILLLIDKYDLYGRIAIPKSHNADDVPDIYRLAASSKGIFINPALTEPFGLTILEAAASGLPVVATENGGPVDIIANIQCGELVDPLDIKDITKALLSYLTDEQKWQQTSQLGAQRVRLLYSWQSHVEQYLSKITQLGDKYKLQVEEQPIPKVLRYPDRAIYTDLDQSLIGDEEGLKKLISVIQNNRKSVSFGVATGRRIDSALALMKRNGIPRPNVLISSLGTRIHYDQSLIEDDAWVEHIDYDWKPRRIRNLLDNLPGLKRQAKAEQTLHKISYYYDVENAPSQQEIVTLLHQKEITANVVVSFGQFIDVIPSRASKGQALRYAAHRLEIPLEHTLVAGGSGADEDMMRGNTLAVVVANRHHEELSQLDDIQRIYFSDSSHAFGILEAIEYYDFFNTCQLSDA